MHKCHLAVCIRPRGRGGGWAKTHGNKGREKKAGEEGGEEGKRKQKFSKVGAYVYKR